MKDEISFKKYSSIKIQNTTFGVFFIIAFVIMHHHLNHFVNFTSSMKLQVKDFDMFLRFLHEKLDFAYIFYNSQFARTNAWNFEIKKIR